MSRDDYISKLFIKNQDKLQQMPADDLWSKLEQQLDTAADVPVTDVGHAPKQFRLYTFLAAASVVFLFLAGTVVLMPQNNQQMAFEIVLEEPMALLVDDAEPYTDDDFILNATAKDEQNEKELVEQEIKIIAAVNKKIEEIATDKVPKEPIAMVDITIVDEVDGVVGSSSILIEAEEDLIGIEYAAEGTLYKGDAKLNKASLNYAKAVPEIANNVQNSAIAEQVITDERNVKLQSNLDFGAVAKEPKNYKSRGAIVNKIEQTQEKRSAILSTHPQLHQFEFLLGENIDFYEKEGVSIEKWTIKNNTTLS